VFKGLILYLSETYSKVYRGMVTNYSRLHAAWYLLQVWIWGVPVIFP